MIFFAVKRRARLIASVTLVGLLGAIVLALAIPRPYAAVAQVVPDPALLVRRPDQVMDAAQSWLHLPETAAKVARALDPATAARLIPPDGGWLGMNGTRRTDAPAAHRSAAHDALLARELSRRLNVGRAAQSYALDIRFTASEPRTAAHGANLFAAILANESDDIAAFGGAVRVVSDANLDTSPEGPATWLVLTTGALLGLAVSVVLAVVLERRFAGIASGADAKARLDLYHLGSVPLLHSVLPGSASPTDAILSSPLSGYAEAYRGILASMRQASGPEAKVVGIASALPSEGKTTIAICLARAAALAGEAVLIIDCDGPKSGSTAALAGKARGPGLAAVLGGSCSLDDVLMQDVRSGAWLLPCSSDGTDLSGLLRGASFAQLLEAVRPRFDRVFLDTAPLLAMAASEAILLHADAAIMIVRWRSTPISAIKAALELMPASWAAWAGLVLTQVDMRKQALHGQGDASAYYQRSSLYYS